MGKGGGGWGEREWRGGGGNTGGWGKGAEREHQPDFCFQSTPQGHLRTERETDRDRDRETEREGKKKKKKRAQGSKRIVSITFGPDLPVTALTQKIFALSESPGWETEPLL